MSQLAGFDQVVAISQWKINEDLEYRYATWKRSLQRFSAHSTDDKGGLMEATLSAPTVEIYVPGEPQKAIFRLNFQDGHFDYAQGDTLQRLSMKGWSLAFLASLPPSKITEDPSDLRPAIPDDVIHNIEKAGSYSLSQILIDLGTANVVEFNFARSVTPGLVASDDNDAPKKQALEKFMKTYLQELSRDGQNVLGYSISVTDPSVANPNAPSFAPVSVSVQTMPFADESNATDETRNRNALLFLEMLGNTAGQSAPRPAIPLSGSHAWIPEGEVGTMIVHKNVFWERFLAGHLIFFAIDAVRFANTIAHWLKAEDMKGDLPDDKPWILSEDRPSADSWSTTDDHSAVFSWPGHNKVSTDIPSGIFEGIHKREETWESAIAVGAEIVPGTHIIKIQTEIKYQYTDYRYDAYLTGDPVTTHRVTKAKVRWEANLAFKSAVNAARLETDVKVQPPECYAEIDEAEHGIFGSLLEKRKVDEYMTEKVEKHLREKVKVEDITTSINVGLQKYPPFVFSGGGTFFMKSPTFTSEYDLQVYLDTKMGREKQREKGE
ncbi:unnamed protein product [Rhizoctonia solani]|uniref:Uncharacterized protein n=1 Tax=Rhizoctonia solani TaxID=456999 RepID=A0A8H3H5K1_9AGAM|nr:unnamed protein product [Rhizoctonia solani]